MSKEIKIVYVPPPVDLKPGDAVDLDPWDEQDGENHTWHDRFNKFRLLGPNRSIREAYRRERIIYRNSKIHAISLGNAEDWNIVSRAWQWDQRALAWDIYCQELQEAEANAILNDGLSLTHKRVEKLKDLEKKLADYIFNEKTKKPSSYIIEQYLEVLDAIAKEVGGRQKNSTVQITGANNGPIQIETSWGRGASVNNAWKQLEQPIIDTQVTEIKESDDD